MLTNDSSTRSSPFGAEYNRLEGYKFRDELGHPLENCVDYIHTVQALEAARDVFAWYFVFGEDSVAARNELAKLGNALVKVAVPKESNDEPRPPR